MLSTRQMAPLSGPTLSVTQHMVHPPLGRTAPSISAALLEARPPPTSVRAICTPSTHSSGSVKWQYNTGIQGPIDSAPALAANDIIYFTQGWTSAVSPDDRGYLHAVRAADGALLWKYEIGWSSSSPAIAADGTLYAAGGWPNAVLYAFRCADGICAVPTPTPQPFKKGDVNCNGEVDSVDALVMLLGTAGLPFSQGPGCPALGASSASAGQAYAQAAAGVFGDVDCSGAVDSVDALLILRFAAHLAVNLPPGCPAIGA